MNELWIAIGINLALGALLYLLLLWFARPDEARLANEDDARRLFAEHYPVAVSAVLLCDAGRSALLAVERGARMGLVDRHARRWNVRLFSAAELARVQLDERGAICIRFRDFGWPSARLNIGDANVRRQWHQQLMHLSAADAMGEGAYTKDTRHA